jgi:hypothetical protein
MIGWSAPASVKPSLVIPLRKRRHFPEAARRRASPSSIRSNTFSEAAAIAGISVLEKR